MKNIDISLSETFMDNYNIEGIQEILDSTIDDFIEDDDRIINIQLVKSDSNEIRSS